MRSTLYRELVKLGDLNSFIPEQLGFSLISFERVILRDLSDYIWDEIKDVLRDSNGEEVSKRLRLMTCEASGVVHVWDKEHWPRDIHTAESPVMESIPYEARDASRDVPLTPGAGISKDDVDLSKE